MVRKAAIMTKISVTKFDLVRKKINFLILECLASGVEFLQLLRPPPRLPPQNQGRVDYYRRSPSFAQGMYFILHRV